MIPDIFPKFTRFMTLSQTAQWTYRTLPASGARAPTPPAPSDVMTVPRSSRLPHSVAKSFGASQALAH